MRRCICRVARCIEDECVGVGESADPFRGRDRGIELQEQAAAKFNVVVAEPRSKKQTIRQPRVLRNKVPEFVEALVEAFPLDTLRKRLEVFGSEMRS